MKLTANIIPRNIGAIEMITKDEVLKLLDYDPVTGIFIWKVRTAICVKIGAEAGSVFVNGNGKPYRRIMIKGRHYYSHRLAWLVLNGKFPDAEIDHVDGSGLNNASANLRAVTRKENTKNKRKQVNNTSGVMGVYWDKTYSEWAAKICLNGKLKKLGFFESFESAVAARKSAEKLYDFHPNHGETRPL